MDYLVRKIGERQSMYANIPAAQEVREKMLRSLIINDVEDEPHIFRIELINTLFCNAKCSHCSNHQLSEAHKKINGDTVSRVLQEAGAHGTPSITFIGGETLTDSNIFDYLGLFTQANLGVSVMTNTISLNRETLDRLKEIGISGVGTTIYDTIPERHDAVLRVPGTLDKMLELLDYAKSIGLGFSLQTIFSRESMRSGATERIRQLCRERGLTLKFNLMMPVGGSAREEEMLTPDEIADYKHMLQSDPGTSSHCVFGGEMERCPMGRTYIGITPNGDLIPCYFIPVSLGNIRDTTFAEYLEYAASFPIFQKFGLPGGYCLVEESKRFFREILEPLYRDHAVLPVDLRNDPEMEQRLRDFEPELAGSPMP